MAEVVVEAGDPIDTEAEVVRHQAEPLLTREPGLASRRVHEAEPGAELARAGAESAPGRVRAHAVVLARVRRVVHDPVHPVARERLHARKRDEVDLPRAQAERMEQGVDGLARIPGVVLQA